MSEQTVSLSLATAAIKRAQDERAAMHAKWRRGRQELANLTRAHLLLKQELDQLKQTTK